MIETDTTKECRAWLADADACDRVAPVVAPMRAAGRCELVGPTRNGSNGLVATLRCGEKRYRLTLAVGTKDPARVVRMLFGPVAMNRCLA